MNADKRGFGHVMLNGVKHPNRLTLSRYLGFFMQFAEHPQHPHVHFHIVPRMIDQPDERRSCKSLEYLGVAENVRVSEEKMNDIGEQIRAQLAKTQLIMNNE